MAAQWTVTDRESSVERWAASVGQCRIVASESAGTAVAPVGYIVRLSGQIDITRLSNAANTLIATYPILRSRFAVRSGVVIQEIVDFGTDRLFRVTDGKRDLTTIVHDETSVRFDLFSGPLFRMTLATVSETDCVLSVFAHHALLDGWSIYKLGRELARLYAAGSCGGGAALLRTRAYSEYVIREQQLLAADAGRQRSVFWQRWFRDFSAYMSSDIPLGAALGKDRKITPPLYIPRRPRESRTPESGIIRSTEFEFLLAVHAVLITRLSGHEALIVEVPLADRFSVSNARVLGYMVQLVPIALRVCVETRFDELMVQIRARLLDAQRQFLPDIAAHCDVKTRKRGRRRHESAFNLIPWSSDDITFEGLQSEELACPEAPPDVALAMYIRERADRMEVRLSYRQGLFSEEEAREHVAQFARLRDYFSCNPCDRIGRPSLAARLERSVHPEALGSSETVNTPRVADVLRRRNATSPSDPVYDDLGLLVTIGDLHCAVERICATLLAHGVRPGDRVAIVPVRSSAYAAVVLGVWTVGAIAVLMDPHHPAHRVSQCLDVAAPHLILTLRPSTAIDPIYSLQRGAHPGETIASPDDSAILFTSGSTGTPKAVRSTHSGLGHFLSWYCLRFNVGSGDRVTVLSGLAHDPIFRDLFVPLWSGAVGVFRDFGASRLVESRAAVCAARPSIIHCTPSIANAIFCAECAPSSVRLICLGGERLGMALAKELQRLFPDAAVVNFYGATETPQAVAYFVVPRSNHLRRGLVPVGRGINDSNLLIMDGERREAGIGELGEICVDTPYLAQGYFGESGQSSARFVLHTDASGTRRIYKTGDLGYYLPSGDAYFARRCDSQVKIDGVRVEPDEVSAVLRSAQSVADAYTVFVTEGPSRLVAFVVPTDTAAAGSDLLVKELMTLCMDALPRASVPAQIIRLAVFPLTSNGKVDRSALVAIAKERLADGALASLKTETELKLSALVAQKLGLSPCAISDDLVTSGLTSLQAMSLISIIERDFAVRLRPEVFLGRPSISKIAALVDTLCPGRELPADVTEEFEDGLI